MNGALAKAMRREAKAAEVKAVGVLAPGLKVVAGNEELTRRRVDDLEKRVGGVADWAAALERRTDILRRGFWGRLHWLLRGK